MATAGSHASGWSDRFTDQQDGAFDMSEHLLEHRGFLPVPIVITEPAVGFGAGAALVFFRESIAESKQRSQASGSRLAPPDIGLLAAFKTENGSKGVGAGYFNSVDGDRYRLGIGAAKAELNLDFYGLTDKPRRFALDAPALVAQGLARLADTDWLAGARYIYLGSSARFESGLPPEVTLPELESHIGRLSLVIDYDSRDNIFTPSSGAFAEIDIGAARPGLGGSSSFDSAMARGYVFLPFGRDVVLGLRGDGATTRGDVPFYAKPFVSLRGVPAMRYQGYKTLVTEAELRYAFTGRWTAVGFAGAGKAYGGRVDFADAQTVSSGGVGFRYLIARKLGLYAGMDVARGPEETAVYIQVGSGWR
jgi:hypothetical protein